MRFEYDAETDILVVTLSDAAVLRSERLPFGSAVADLDADGNIVSLEIMGAGCKYDHAFLAAHPERFDEPLVLAEAARLAGMTAEALKHAILRGRLGGRKIGRNWTTTLSELTAYLDSRKHGGPGSRAAAG